MCFSLRNNCHTCYITCALMYNTLFHIFHLFYSRAVTFQLGEFQRKCTAFFMELVSHFCFARENETAVDPAVIELMMSYVTKELETDSEEGTKQFSPFTEYGVDPSPVVRSYILQQLLRARYVLTVRH